MAKGHGGRRVGAGRKAGVRSKRAAKTGNFSTRIHADTREAIEAAAATSGLSVSAMVEKLIQRGLAARREASRNGPTQALAYLLGEIVDVVSPRQLQVEWRDDPFMFDSVRNAFDVLMMRLRPEGDAVPLSDRDPLLANTTAWGPLNSAKDRGEYAATIVWHLLTSARESPKSMLDGAPSEMPKDVAEMPYDLHRAWKGLNERNAR